MKREGPKYVIDVEDPVSFGVSWALGSFPLVPPSDHRLSPQFSCPSLEAVVNYFVTHTKRALVPFLMEEDYEKVLGVCDVGQPGLHGDTRWGASFGPPRCLQAARPLCCRLRALGSREWRECMGRVLPGLR